MNAAKLDPALCRRLAALANGPSLAVLPLTTPERADIAAQLIAAAEMAEQYQAVLGRLEHTAKLAGLWTGPAGEDCRTCGGNLYDHIGTDLRCPSLAPQVERTALTEERVRDVVRAAFDARIALCGHPDVDIIAARVAKELAGATAPSATDTITISIPLDLVETVARALESLATHYLNDTGHSPEGIAVLQRDADRLDEIAESIRQLAGEAE